MSVRVEIDDPVFRELLQETYFVTFKVVKTEYNICFSFPDDIDQWILMSRWCSWDLLWVYMFKPVWGKCIIRLSVKI